MKKFKQILFITLWTGLIIGLVLSLGFVNKDQDAMKCKSLDIHVNQDGDLYFLNKKDIAQLIHDRGDSVVGTPRSAVNIPEIENKLNSHEDIANAEVFVTIDGKVKVEVKQRKPIIRVINTNGESYYIDEEGKLMPLSAKYTAKVLIANGNILESYVKNNKHSVADISKTERLKNGNVLADLYAMATYINGDEFWKAQVHQIYIDSLNDMEIVPMVGDQKIIFGDTTSMDEKFKKLLVFYQEGLNTTGWWDKYSVINLKFKNQVVCTKKVKIVVKKIIVINQSKSPAKTGL